MINELVSILSRLAIRDLLEITILTILIYQFLLLIKGTRGWHITLGITALVLLQVVWPVLPLPVHLDRTSKELGGWEGLGINVGEETDRMPDPSRTFVFGLRYQIASELAGQHDHRQGGMDHQPGHFLTGPTVDEQGGDGPEDEESDEKPRVGRNCGIF